MEWDGGAVGEIGTAAASAVAESSKITSSMVWDGGVVGGNGAAVVSGVAASPAQGVASAAAATASAVTSPLSSPVAAAAVQSAAGSAVVLAGVLEQSPGKMRRDSWRFPAPLSPLLSRQPGVSSSNIHVYTCVRVYTYIYICV